MQNRNLVCRRCNGYYPLEDDESPDDFLVCECGGDLILVDDIEWYYESGRNKTSKSKTLILVLSSLIIAFILLVNIFYPPISLSNTLDISNKFILGSDNRGYVTKEVNGKSLNTKAIAVVTGIHPREKLSKRVTTDVIRDYQLSSNIDIVHYEITVTNNPEIYNAGRNNGEGLAKDYILPDIKKSSYDLVIICHDHKPGYGSGFYIATPEMDENSVKLAQSVKKTLGDFKYYRADNIREHSSSALKFSKPLASSGYKTLVYEIPGWESYNKAYNMTYRFLDVCSLYL